MFESLWEAAPIAMVGFDQGGVIRFVNRQSELLFGFDRDELIGQPLELVMPQSFDRIGTAQSAGHATDSTAREMGAVLELTGRRHEGSEFPVNIRLSSIETLDGPLVTAVVRDVTDIRRQAQDLQRLAAIIRYSDDAIIGTTLDCMITSWNPAAERMYGYSSQEIVGKSITLLRDKDRADEMTGVLAKIRDGKPTEHYETVRVRSDGTLFPVALTVSPIFDADGSVVGASTIARDVTAQMKAIDSAVSSSLVAFNAARSMIESSLDLLVSISPEGMITDVNQATTKVTGVPRAKLIGTAFSQYFTEPEKADRIYQLVFAEGMVVDYPLTMRHTDGTVTEVLYNASVHRDGRGQVLGVFAAARDVTKQVRAQAEIAAQLENELERLAELERFQRLTVGREIKMIELKKEIEGYRKRLPAADWSGDDGF